MMMMMMTTTALTPPSDEVIRALRVMTRGAYALQKLRIQSGLRLCANFRDKLKLEADPNAEPPEEGEELSEKALKLIDELKAIYGKLTEGVAKNRTLPKREGFIGLGVVSEFTELVLIHQYLGIEKQEKEQFRLLTETLEMVPIYNSWLKHQKGIGPTLAAVLLSWFDITKAPNPSKFWAYAGLDVVSQVDGLARSRRKEHLIEREYTDRNGEVKTKLSTTFDPWLQSRLLGVMGGSFLRTGSPYRKHYDDYRHRIETDPNRAKGTLADKKQLNQEGKTEESAKLWHPYRIHRASIRYMVKQFIADFWRAWRLEEGLPVVPTYHEARRGYPHGGEPPATPRSEAAE